MNTPRKLALRHVAFFLGLVALIGSAVAYVWAQGSLRESVQLERVLAKNVGRIMTLDEILTMSARMASSSKDPRYEERYNAHVEELDSLIKATLGLVSDAEVTQAVASTDAANLRLVDMETQSFELDKNGRHAEALALLEGDNYKVDKAAYALGMERAFGRLQQLTAAQTAATARWTMLAQIAALVSLMLVVGAWATQQYAQRKRAAEYATQLELTVAQRTAELAHKNRSMRLVFDTVQQGLIGVDLAGSMSPERSAIVDVWLGSCTTQMKLSDYVRPHDPDFANWLELGLEQLREGILPIEVCIGQMPKHLRLGARSIAVSYEAVLADGKCEGFLVVMSDITAELGRQRFEAEQRDLVQVLEHLARDRNGFLNFLAEADSIVAEVSGSRLLPGGSLSRLLHTLKGTASQFGLSGVAGVCHTLEDRLRDDAELSQHDRELLATTWQSLRDRIHSMVGERSHSHLEVARQDYDSALQLIRRRASHDDIATALLGWELDPIQARLERLGEYGQALAQRLGKPEPIALCDGGGLRVDNASWAPLWSACVHLVRNAVDHGLEDPDQRQKGSKPPRGRLTLSAVQDGQAIVLRFSDDGRGVQWEQLAQKAMSRGLPFETEAQKVEALFQDDLSTIDVANEISGRGLGMAAVREQVSIRGGTVKVLSREQAGTTVELRIPLAHTPARSIALTG